MSAARMREAATVLRSPDSPLHGLIAERLADWLDAEAVIYAELDDLIIRASAEGVTVRIPYSTREQADLVAEAVMEAAS